MIFVFIVIASFCVFIAVLIFLTRKEESMEKKLMESPYHTEGVIDKVERTSKSLSKGELFFTYSVSYKYKVDQKEYRAKILYEVKSDVLEVFPEIVDVYYDIEHPNQSIIKINLEHSKIKKKETIQSLIPALVIAIAFGMLLITIFG